MQPVTVQERVEFASLGWRFTAVLIDTVVLFGILIAVLMAYVFVLAAQGKIDPNNPAAAQALSQEISRQLGDSNLLANVIIFGSLFLYYVVLEAIFAASIGKLVCRMRVTALDGSRPTGGAIVLRNLIRVPEAMLLYIPSGVSCAASPRRQRLGDHAARTVVVRRTTLAGAAQGAPRSGPPAFGAPVPPAPVAPPSASTQSVRPSAEPAAAPGPPPVADALARLKTTALATHGAHLNYQRFSERELAAGAVDPVRAYSEEYVSAWFTLTDAVAALRATRDEAGASASAAGRTLDDVCAEQPDLAHLLRELAPYFTVDGDEAVHEAFLAVARREGSAS